VRNLSIFLLVVLLSACVSGPSSETRAGWAKEEKLQAEHEDKNTDAIVELFMSEVWNQPIKKLMNLTSEMDGFKTINPITDITFTRDHIYFKADDVHEKRWWDEARECNISDKLSDHFGIIAGTDGYKIDKSQRTGIADAKKWKEDGAYQMMGITFSFYYKSSRSFSPKCDSIKIMDQNGAMPTKLGWEIRDRLVSKGVPLIYCTKGISRHSTELNTRHANCTLNPVRQSGAEFDVTISSEESYGSGVFPFVFRFNFYLKNKSDANKTLAQLYMMRFSDPAYLKATLKRHNSYLRWKIGEQQKNLSEIAAIEAEMAAEKQRSRDAMAAAFGASIMEGAAKLRNSRVGLADSQIQALGNISRVQSQVDSAEIISYIPRGEPTPALLNQRYQTWCAQQGNRYNPQTKNCTKAPQSMQRNPPSYEAEKQNCLNAGKTWNNGCDYANDVVIQGWSQGNTAVVQQPTDIANSRSSKQSGRATNQGSHTANTNDSTAAAGNETSQNARALIKHAEAFCWETYKSHYRCDGPLQKLISSYSTLAKALDMVDCKKTTDIGDGWYDCNRPLKSHERDVRELRK